MSESPSDLNVSMRPRKIGGFVSRVKRGAVCGLCCFLPAKGREGFFYCVTGISACDALV
ncbi:MAG: hypothetical protein ACI8Z5_001082 [Lentimonas sp.]